MNRALKAVLFAVGVSGIVYLLSAMSSGGPREPAASALLSPGRLAYAQRLGAPLRYRIVTERSEACYRVRDQLAGINSPSDTVETTSAIEGSIQQPGAIG